MLSPFSLPLLRKKHLSPGSKDGNPLIDGRGSRRRMRGRLDVVERERQGQGSIFVCRRVPLRIYPLALQGIQDRD